MLVEIFAEVFLCSGLVPERPDVVIDIMPNKRPAIVRRKVNSLKLESVLRKQRSRPVMSLDTVPAETSEPALLQNRNLGAVRHHRTDIHDRCVHVARQPFRAGVFLITNQTTLVRVLAAFSRFRQQPNFFINVGYLPGATRNHHVTTVLCSHRLHHVASRRRTRLIKQHSLTRGRIDFVNQLVKVVFGRGGRHLQARWQYIKLLNLYALCRQPRRRQILRELPSNKLQEIVAKHELWAHAFNHASRTALLGTLVPQRLPNQLVFV